MGIRSLQHSKANRLEIKKGVPSPNEGNNGELRLGITAKGIFLYVKYGNRWYQLGDAAISSGGQFSAQGIASQGAGTLATSIDRGNQSLNMGGNVVLSGNTISNTGSNTGVKFEDSATLAIDVANTKIGTNGYMTLTDNQLDVSSGNLDIDVAGNIIMDADGGSVTIVDTNPTGYYPSFTLQSTDAGAAGPIMSFKHDSASPAIGDDVGGIYFMGDDDGGNVSGYGSITAEIQDPTNGAEEGKISFHVLSGGGASAAGYSMVGNSGVADVNIGYGATSTTTIAGDLTVNGDTTTFSSANANDPLVAIKNTANDATGARLQFVKDKGAAGADGDDIGIIEFVGDDAAQTQTTFAKIVAEVSEADDTDEAGKLSFYVAESDGTTTALAAGLVLEGEHATDGEVDVTIAAGAASTTTIAGTLTMGSTAAMTNAGLLSVVNQSNITGLGTITSGTWTGTAVASAYLDADTAHLTTDQTFTGVKQINKRKFTVTGTTHFETQGDIVYLGSGSTTAGELCYLKADGAWAATDADAVATSGGVLLALALGTDPDVDGMLLRGMFTLDHDPGTIADELYISTTAGDITATAPSATGDIVRVIGYCLDSTNGQIWFNPSNDFIVLA